MRRRGFMAVACAVALHGWSRAAAARSDGGRVLLPDVRLRDHAGGLHRLRALCEGRPVVVGFFYTGCSTVCPPQTAALRALRERLDDAATAAALRRTLLLSISVDPLADSPQAISAYAQRFELRLGRDAGWLMLGGDLAELRPVWAAFGVPAGDPEAHSSLLWLGGGRQGPWTRASALAPTARLVALLEGLAT